jgi:hypothetical protein
MLAAFSMDLKRAFAVIWLAFKVNPSRKSIILIGYSAKYAMRNLVDIIPADPSKGFQPGEFKESLWLRLACLARPCSQGHSQCRCLKICIT